MKHMNITCHVDRFRESFAVYPRASRFMAALGCIWGLSMVLGLHLCQAGNIWCYRGYEGYWAGIGVDVGWMEWWEEKENQVEKGGLISNSCRALGRGSVCRNVCPALVDNYQSYYTCGVRIIETHSEVDEQVQFEGSSITLR
jgi:hypothetical protein